MLFSGNVAPWVAKVGFLFPRFRASICESSQQNVHQTVARARFAFQNVKQLSRSERFLECARDCSEFDFRKKSQKTAVRRLAPDLCGGVPIVSAVRRLVDLVRRYCYCYARLQLAVTKRIDTAVRSKA